MKIEQQIKHAEAELIKLDPKLGKLIKRQGPVIYSPRTDYFFSLCRSIVGQQISVAASAAIFGRLETATSLDPAIVLNLSTEQFRTIGLSRQKEGYIRDLAQHFVENAQIYNHLGQLSDDEAIRDLTAIKGIGVWTAQMFMMFTLTRLDVFAVDDVGLQRAMMRLYGWDNLPNKQMLEQTAEHWRPYRTVASWHLWKSLQNAPV